MWRGVCAALLLVGCRFNFDPVGSGPSDGSAAPNDATDGPTTMTDGPPDAMVTPVVQAVSRDTASAAPVTIDTTNGLATVTPGNMVVVVCGGLNAPALCTPSSTPAATWTNIDPGSTLGVHVACNAPAITSVTVTNGGTAMNLVVTEWSGVVAAATCLDTKRISTPCATAPTTWDTGFTPTVSQNRELLVTVGRADAPDAGWTVDAPYQIGFDAKGVNSIVNVLVGYQKVDASPMAYKATGTVNQYQFACFTDVFAFKAL